MSLQPTSFRLPENLKSRMVKASDKSGVDMVDILTTAMEDFFKEYKTPDQIFEAVLRHRRSQLKTG